jgi:hypothetical protein
VLATSTNDSLNSPRASVIVAGLLDLVIGDDYEIFEESTYAQWLQRLSVKLEEQRQWTTS